MLSGDRGGGRVNYKLEQLFVQQRKDVKFRPASLLNHIRHVKSAFGNLNVRFTKLVFLKHCFPNANAKFVLFIKDTRHAPLYAGPSSPAFLRHLCPDAIIGNTRAASLLSRDARLAFGAATQELRS